MKKEPSTQQVRIRADVVPSLKAIAQRRSTTQTEVISEAVVEWLEKNDPTWKDTVMLHKLKDRLDEVVGNLSEIRAEIDDANQQLEQNTKYPDYEEMDDTERSGVEKWASDARRRHDALVISEKRLVAAVAALSGESEDIIRNGIEHE